jgi:prepilin-type N-terminal cleavage/methylation domain-containing protein
VSKLLNEQGLTFLEMMVSVTILGMMILALYGIIDSSMAMFRTSDAHLEQIQNMRVAMESLGRDLREATAISFELRKNELTIYLPDNKTEKYGLASESIYGPSGLKGKKLWKTTESNPIASYLTHFEVINSGKLVTVKFKATSPKGRIITLENKFALRN